MQVVPFSAILDVFLDKGLIILHGTRCCKYHVKNKSIKEECVKNLNFFDNDTYMNSDEISHFLENLRKEVKKERSKRNKGNKLNYYYIVDPDAN